MEKTYNKKLVASVVLMVSSLVLLAGLTFAWFTDSAVSSNNKIQAGTLDIEATVANVEANATTKYQIDGVNGDAAFGFGNAVDITTSDPIITEEKWEPGATNAKLLTVTNKGNLAAQVKLQFDIKDEGLQDALWFDFVQVKNGQATGQFTRRPMSTLNTFASGLELPVGPSDDKGAAAYDDFPNSVSFILVYGMYEEAGNNYQGKSFSADVTILATQHTYEADGFGNIQYDEEAKYPAMDTESLETALNTNSTVELQSDVLATAGQGTPQEQVDSRCVIRDNKTVLNLNCNSVYFESEKGNKNFSAFYLSDGAAMTVNGEGTIEAEIAYCFHLMGREETRTTLTINGGTYIGDPTAVNVQYGTAYINGGFFNCKPAIGYDSPYTFALNCIDANYKSGLANIIVTGGTFVNFNPANNQAEGPGTDFVPEGYIVTEEKHGEDTWYTVVPDSDVA